MVPKQYELQIIENGESIYEDAFMFLEGKSVGDALKEVLAADKGASEPTHVNVNGTTYPVSELDSMTITGDVEIELLTKSNSGVK